MVRPDHALKSVPPDLGIAMRTVTVKRPPDLFAAPAFAYGRVALVAAIAIGGALFPPDAANSRLFFQLVTFAGLPVSLILVASLGRLRPHTHAFVSAAADVTAAISLHALVDDGAQVARLAYVAIPAIVAITTGFLPALAVIAIGAGANAVIDFTNTDSVSGDFNPVVHVVRFAMATALVYLVSRATEERRRAQASERAASVKAETILSKVGSAVVVTDAKGRLLEWNDAATGLMSPVDDGDDVRPTCETALNLYADGRPLDCSNGCGLLWIRSGRAAHDLPEICRHLPDGRTQPLVADAAPLTDSSGAVVEVVHSLVDVTRLKQADEAKTLFLATASHELKTPLTVIGGFAELMLSVPDLPETQKTEALETIRRRTTQLAAIVDRLLLSSRIESGKVQVNLEPVDVEPVVREQVDSLARATGRALRLKVEGPVACAQADASAVATIVDHLLENAIRYSPGGEPVEITIATGKDVVGISVRDRGIGMDRQQQERCFERFWQAESSDVRRFGGTGIGLYIVKSLAEAMGGSVSVASRVGRGTTFTLDLPKSPPLYLSGENGAILGDVLDQLESPSAGGAA